MRIAPFVGALLLAFAFLNLKHDGGSPGRLPMAVADSREMGGGMVVPAAIS